MTKFQKVFCVCLSLGFLGVFLLLFGQPLYRGNIFRQLPLYCFLEQEARSIPSREDPETYREILARNGGYLGEQVQQENQEKARKTNEKKAAEENRKKKKKEAQKAEKKAEKNRKPCPKIDLSPEKLADYEYLLGQFFILDSNTATSPQQLNAAEFLKKNMKLKKEAEGPQILIYHSHSQETFADSREGKEEDTIVGVGNYLTEILTETYGYQVLHVKEAFDMATGALDRNAAYDYAGEYLEKLLAETPSVEVIIDLHRDGVSQDRRLVTEIDGKQTAQIMFYNGLSYSADHGPVTYLPNPHIQDNLAFSFQLEYQAAQYYPDFYRGIYLAELRYNLHMRPKSILLEAGAQTNTVREVKNAMKPFADILNRVLRPDSSDS